VVAWLVGLGFFFPVFWMVLTAFKQEGDAATSPPTLFFTPTLDQYGKVFDQGIGPAMLNSVWATAISTLLVLLLGTPAAFALSLRPVRKTQDALFFFMSTKMLPIVAAILPLYVIVSNIGLLDNIWALVILYTSMNLPIAVWMMRSFFLEVPGELLEAASLDGASLWRSVGLARHRSHGTDLRDLRLERVLLRGQPHRGERSDHAGVPRRFHRR
jgi:sorbitol/mannitol transport system permease protein